MQTKKPLPDALMGAIRATIADDSMSQQDRFEAVILIAHGYGLFTQHEGNIDPVAYAIPAAQSLEVANLLAGMGADPVNASLGWMNYGPSSYEAE